MTTGNVSYIDPLDDLGMPELLALPMYQELLIPPMIRCLE